MGLCQGFSTCYGYNCGGGAVEQTAIGYANAEGPHPKCGVPPEYFTFDINCSGGGNWVGSLTMVTSNIDSMRQSIGCQPSNCTCEEPECQCFRTDLGGNTNYAGHMSASACQAQGNCVGADMTVQGCCEDPITGQRPFVEAGFGHGLNQTECECRGGSWSTYCKPWTQAQLDECDRPKCDSCPNHCVVWQGHADNTCGPPVLYCLEDDCEPPGDAANIGYGVTIPWEMTLVCIAPAKTAHGHLANPPDYGSWILQVSASRPDTKNVLGTVNCKSWEFTNVHGYGDLDMGSVCKDGTWAITVDIPVKDTEFKTSCRCSCPCQQQVSNVSDGEKCVCYDSVPPNLDCVLGDGFECIEGSTDPPDCDSSCWVPKPACPGMDALWNRLSADPNTCIQGSSGNPANAVDGGCIDEFCNSGSSGGNKGELLGVHKFDEKNCDVCCEVCNGFCEDACVCEEIAGVPGASSICGVKTGSNRNESGHGCSKDPKRTFEGTAKEGQCCVPTYGTPTGPDSPNTGCIEESYYTCGCLPEGQSTAKLTIIANAQQSSTVTHIGGYENGIPVGGDGPGVKVNECGAVDAICDLSNKSPSTDGCIYTKWPDTSCAYPLPAPDHTEGVRCPNSLVWEQPTYGHQCTLIGGAANHSMADFPIKPGMCLNARPERWHLRPQFLFPHLWAICYKKGPGEPGPQPCDPPADKDAMCIQHPEAVKFVADLGHTHGMIGECNIYCVGWWEIIDDCYRAWELDLCVACMGDCWEDAKLVGAVPWCCGHCDIADWSADWGCDGKWPGIFPFLYYHPPEDVFCPYGEYFPAISCPAVPGSPAATLLGQSGQVYYPGNIETKWTGCCGNQPEGCECCYPCGHPAWDPTCRIRNLISGNICDICFECMCESSRSEGYNANQVYKSDGCPNGCQQAAGGGATGQCVQVVQDGGSEVAGCGQFMQEMGDIPETCPAPIYCPEGLIPHDKYGGGYCHEGDTCCNCLREKDHWQAPGTLSFDGPTTNPLGWKLGAPVLYDMAWYPLKEAVCMLEPCGMGESSEGLIPGSPGGDPGQLYDKGTLKVSVTLMRPGTSTEVGESIDMYDHQSTGEIIGVTGIGKPIKITSRLQVGQLEINLAPGDPIFIGIVNDTEGMPFGSKVGGNLAANGQFRVLAVSGNEFTIALPGAGPVIGDGDWTDGGTWHYYDPNDSGASCIAPDQQCAFGFEFIQGGVDVGTSPKLLPESLFIECVEEAFTEWSNILESLWSPRADYIAVDRRHGSWGGGTDLFPGSHNINPGLNPLGLPAQTNSHQLRVRFINMGHEAALNNEVPSNKTDRYMVPQWSRNTDYPMVGRCVTRLPGGDTAGGVVPERQWENMASCITNGHCYAKGCSANDARSTSVQLSSSNKCEEMPHTGAGIVANNAKDCLSTKYYACLTHPKDQVMRYVAGEEFGHAVDSDLDGDADLFPSVPLRWYLDPKYVREDIGDEACCNHVDGYWELIDGDWSSDFGNDEGIFNPGFSELFPCVPKNAECCQGTVSCVSPGGDPFITPTNTYVPSSCCKEYEKLYGQCLGDYNLDGDMDVMAGCDYDCCGYGYAGWCVDKNDYNNVYWSTESCPGCGGRDACRNGTAGVGCTEKLSTCGDGKPSTAGTDAQTCGALQWQATQRVLRYNVAANNGGIAVSLRFPGGNVGDTLERTDCDLATSELFKIGDYIKIGSEYMGITSINRLTETLSVSRGVSIPDADPVHPNAEYHGRGDSIYLWSNNMHGGGKNCVDVAHCVDDEGNLIGDANEGIGYFPIDNRSLYHLCRDSVRISPWCCPDCSSEGGCWISGERGQGSSRGVPIGISSLYNDISSTEMRLTITEIDNTGNLFVDNGSDAHDPSIIATPEKFTLKPDDIIRIESENMKVVQVIKTSKFHANVKGFCAGDVNLQGMPGPTGPTYEKPDCEFDDCNFVPNPTACRHWYGESFDAAIGWSNCAGEPLGDKSWPNNIVNLYEVIVTRGEDGTSAVRHEKNKWVRKKYGDIINDCGQCTNNLFGIHHRYGWVGPTTPAVPPRPSNPNGSIWRPAAWHPKFDWVANIWEAKVTNDTPFYGKTGANCKDWPEKDTCCPRPGQVRIGMVNWYDALRERWAQEGRGQCYDCNTGVIIGNRTTFGPNSVELHGQCLRYDEDRYDKLLIGSTSAFQADCLALNCGAVNDCDGVCSDTNYTIKTDCISNNKIWATWDWSAYINKDVCSNAGHCWDYRDPPLVLASGNPFSCGYMGNMRCLKKIDGVWIPCIPAAGRPYGRANNKIGADSDDNYSNCNGFRPAYGSNVIPAQPGGGDPQGAVDDGGEACVCITEGREGIAGDLYIDSSVRWRPDWVDESDKPGAYSIKRVLMKQIGHMLGLPEGGDVMSPIGGPADNAITVGDSTYNQLVRMYEPRWWNRGGRNDYWWSSGVYAGDFK